MTSNKIVVHKAVIYLEGKYSCIHIKQIKLLHSSTNYLHLPKRQSLNTRMERKRTNHLAFKPIGVHYKVRIHGMKQKFYAYVTIAA